MKAWVFAQMTFDASRNATALMEEFIDGFYSTEAAPLGKLHIHFAYTLYKLHNTLAISRHRLGRVEGVAGCPQHYAHILRFVFHSVSKLEFWTRKSTPDFCIVNGKFQEMKLKEFDRWSC